MSNLAREEYKDARELQLNRNEARRIRSKVESAESDSGLAGRRWPFELLQNAHDAGPRPGASAVDIDLVWDRQNLTVSHTGKPFELQELAALLSGGSSKGYDDESTTGRFGTGFLVTHALSTEVDVEGVLRTTEGFERFQVPLRRGGDETSIFENIDETSSALEEARHIELAPEISTARLVYRDANKEVVQLGLERLTQALPYLYATCDYLGTVRIVERGKETIFQPRQVAAHHSSAKVSVQGITHTTSHETQQLAVLRATDGGDDRAAALVLTQETEDATNVLLPDEDFPRVFVTFPIAGSQFLPFDVVLDGKFKPAQERDSIQMTPKDRRLFERALSALPGLLKTAIDSEWEGAHHLAHLSAPTQTFAKEETEDEQTWWQATVKQVASSMAKKPVVRTEAGLFPAVSKNGKPSACFAVPAANANSTCAWPAPLDAMHTLVSRVEGLHPVELDIARPWEGVSADWQHLDIPVRRVGLTELAAQVKKQDRGIAQLPVSGSPHQWLAHFLELAGELDAADRSLFRKLLPNQHGDLNDPGRLHFDGGIAEDVKDAAALIGLDLRKELLHPAFVEEVSRRKRTDRALGSLVSSRTTEKEAVERVIQKLRDKLPVGDKTGAEAEQAMKASAQLAAHLGPGSEKLRELPYVLKDGTVVRMKSKGQHLAPISEWPEAERTYASLYPENRVLAEDYASGGSCHAGLSPATEGEHVLPGIMHPSVRKEVPDDLLAGLTGRDDLSDVKLRNQRFEQIALLSSVVVQRCGKNEQLAKLLLDFVLHVAVQSLLWKEMRPATGTKDREAVEFEVCAALWPAELSVRPWIPRESEEETVPFPASESVLSDFLKPEQIRDNEEGAAFLHEWFGFSPLQLYLKGLEEGEERDALEADLAKLSRAGATVLSTLAQADAATIQEVAQTVAEKQRQDQFKEQNRRFGIAVQKAVESAFSEQGFALNLVDHGFDYLMAPEETVELDELRYAFEFEEYLLEVKATTTGEVHLTPTQARTAAEEKERFLLCVVDLRGTPRRRLSEPWEPEDVRGKCHLLAVGAKVEETVGPVLSLVGAAGTRTIRLRGENHLRYAVPTALWKNGLSIEKWVRRYVSGEEMGESKDDRAEL